MRLTDDYLIISESEDFNKNIIKILSKMSKENNFEFNSAKFKSNFKMAGYPKNLHKKTIQWIGKTINLKTMELEHLQITNRKEVFYTVRYVLFNLIFRSMSIFQSQKKHFQV